MILAITLSRVSGTSYTATNFTVPRFNKTCTKFLFFWTQQKTSRQTARAYLCSHSSLFQEALCPTVSFFLLFLVSCPWIHFALSFFMVGFLLLLFCPFFLLTCIFVIHIYGLTTFCLCHLPAHCSTNLHGIYYCLILYQILLPWLCCMFFPAGVCCLSLSACWAICRAVPSTALCETIQAWKYFLAILFLAKYGQALGLALWHWWWLGGPGREHEGGYKKELPMDEVQLNGINQADQSEQKPAQRTSVIGFVPFTSIAMTKPHYPWA